MMIGLLLFIAIGMFAVERWWPAARLPRVRNWWGRVILVNAVQAGLVIVAGLTWDRWMRGISLINIKQYLGTIPSAIVAYLTVTFIYYWWHRLRHESKLFWLLCHQLHHSPKRIEIVTSFYKHPVEITINSLLSSAIMYLLIGCSVKAAVLTTFLTAVAEFFYHWNIKTPYWFGFLVQRPESHRIHHKYRHHTQNFADLPIWDMLGGTFKNPNHVEERCGYDDWREDRFEDMLAFRDVNREGAEKASPLHFLPTCIGCAKRWACSEANQSVDSEHPGS